MSGSDWLAARVFANYSDASALTVNSPRGCSDITPSTQSTARALEYKLREVVEFVLLLNPSSRKTELMADLMWLTRIPYFFIN